MLTCLLAIYFFTFLNGTFTVAYDQCPTSNSENPLTKLKDYLTCMYDPYIGPVNSQNATNVTIRMILKYFTYNEYSNSMIIDAWIVAVWRDRHLSWNPSDFDNLKYVWLHTHEIWTPGIYISNTVGEPKALVGTTRCLIFKQGSVLCVPPIRVELLCVPDLSRYPFDSQNCSMYLETLDLTEERLNMMMRAVSTFDLKKSGEWRLDSWKVLKVKHRDCCPERMSQWLVVKFEFSRLAASHVAVIVVPMIVVIILSILTLLIPLCDKGRMKICYLSIFSHFLQLQFLAYNIPLKGENVPLIVVFSRDSLLMAVFVFVFTIIARNLYRRETLPPSLISSIVRWCSFQQITNFLISKGFTLNGVSYIKSEEDQEQIINDQEVTLNVDNDWMKFGKLLNNVLLFIYILTYLVMIITIFV